MTALGFSTGIRLGPMSGSASPPVNLLTNGSEFTAAPWTLFNATGTANVSGVADKIIPDATATATHGVFRTGIAVDTASLYTYTVDATANGYDAVQFTVHNNDAVGAGSWGSTFNLATGLVHLQGSSTEAFIRSLGGGKYRLIVIVTSDDISAEIRLWVGPAASLNGTNPVFNGYAGNGTSGVNFENAQLFKGRHPTV